MTVALIRVENIFLETLQNVHVYCTKKEFGGFQCIKDIIKFSSFAIVILLVDKRDCMLLHLAHDASP